MRVTPWSRPRFVFTGALGLALTVGATMGACGGSGGAGGDDLGGGDTGDGSDGSGGDGTSGDGPFTIDSGGSDGDGGDGGKDSPTGFDGSPPVDADFPCDGCAPFPPKTTPECPATALTAPKISYPPNGVLLPPNMNVLEVQWKESPGATLYDVEFSNAITSVRVESKCNPVPNVRGGASLGCGVTLSLPAWIDIANENRDGDPVKITVRATKDGTCVATSTDVVSVSFAKDDLAGGIYYWQSATFGGLGGKTGGIYSHDFGTFDPTPTPFYPSGATGTCVGCHNRSRDGARMALATDDPDADDEFGDVKTHVMDVATRTVLGGATMSPGFQTFTHDHKKMIASTFKTFMNQSFTVFDGDGATLLKTNDLPAGMKGTHPDLSRDDGHLVFVVPGNLPGSTATSISKAGDHHFLGGSIYASTFDPTSNALGAPVALLTAAGTTNFYYPSFSPNGSFLVLDEAPKEDAFYNRNARVKLLHFPPAAGSKTIDLPALNVADGLSNSWPRWSPFVQTYKGKKLLWLTFSSNRDYGLHLLNQGLTFTDATGVHPVDNCYPPSSPTEPAYGDNPQPLSKAGVGYTDCQQPQIWMAAVIIDDDASLDAKDRSFPAFWLPFQDVNSHNHSAQWVEKVLSPPPPPPPGDAGPDGAIDGSGPPLCLAAGASCAAGSTGVCCADVVCCRGTCLSTCIF